MGGALRDGHRLGRGWIIGGRTEVRAPRVPFGLAHAGGRPAGRMPAGRPTAGRRRHEGHRPPPAACAAASRVQDPPGRGTFCRA